MSACDAVSKGHMLNDRRVSVGEIPALSGPVPRPLWPGEARSWADTHVSRTRVRTPATKRASEGTLATGA